MGELRMGCAESDCAKDKLEESFTREQAYGRKFNFNRDDFSYDNDNPIYEVLKNADKINNITITTNVNNNITFGKGKRKDKEPLKKEMSLANNANNANNATKHNKLANKYKLQKFEDDDHSDGHLVQDEDLARINKFIQSS